MIGPAWQETAPALVLASASAARRCVMQEAGLQFDTCPADLDEAATKHVADREGWPAARLALHLAQAKALAVSRIRPGCLVVGADQVLSAGGRRYDKPESLAQARLQLMELRGTVQTLDTATILARDGVVVWQHVTTPRLTMRCFSEALLDLYISAEGERLLSCVGACRVEGVGQQLFDSIDADRSAVLGLPILPLLSELRCRGLLMQ